jgi:hypothetical protein
MQAASLSPQAGWHWVRDGYRIFRRQPFALFGWALSIGVLVLLATLLAPVGPVFFIALMPAVTVMTLTACRDVEADRIVRPLMLWRLLGQPGMARQLLGMGAIYVCAVLLAGFVVFLPFMGGIADALQMTDATEAMEALFISMRTPLMLFGLVYLAIAALFWHAPALVAWHGMGVRKAFFFSGVACWRNKGAFVVYGLVWAGLLIAVEVAAALLRGIGLPANLVAMVQMPVNFAVAAILYCSFYPTYTSVFYTHEEVA